MQTRSFGRFGSGSVLTLGGAGVASHWGAVTRDEGLATLREAVASGVTLLDMAPKYGNLRAEQMVGEAFDGTLPPNVKVLTKVLFEHDLDDLAAELEKSVAGSLQRMRLARLDFLLLHNQLVPDDKHGIWPGMAWSRFEDRVRPLLSHMVAGGRLLGWGMSAIGASSQALRALADTPCPEVVEAITNPLDALGNLHTYDEPAVPRMIISAAAARDVAVLGVRVAGAGALTSALDRVLPPDHPVARDYARAAPFRAVAARLGMSPARLSLRYVLAMPGVSSIVLGVKDRRELAESLQAEASGPLAPDIVEAVDTAVRRTSAL